MKTSKLAALAFVLAATGFSQAQDLLPTPSPAPAEITGNPADRTIFDPAPSGGPRTWIGAEYLMWWVKDAPVPFPLITANSIGNLPALGQPGTSVLYGGSGQNMGLFSGVRVELGSWLDDQHTSGVEISGFVFASRTTTFTAKNSGGDTTIGVPFFNGDFGFNAPPGSQDAAVVSIPGLAAGTVTINNTTQLWGTEINGLLNLARSPNLEVNLLYGFRYLNLCERLDISTSEIFAPPFGFNYFSDDSFQTENQFFGGQLGVQGSYRFGPLSVEGTFKIAMGVSDESVTIFGSSHGLFPGVPSSMLGGIYAQPTNIGHQSKAPFSIVPEIQLKLGYDLTSRLRTTVGYDFLYWSNVVRPGNQIDPTLNLSQHFGGPLVGAANPTPLFNTTSFFAQGVSFGLEFRY